MTKREGAKLAPWLTLIGWALLGVALQAAVLRPAEALATEEVPHLVMSQIYLYGQRFSGTTQREDKTGYTGGVYLSYDWTGTESKKLGLGLATEVMAGGGAFGSDIALELMADILGVVGRYKISADHEVGFFYEPIELYAMPVGGYIGSKLALKYRFQRLQVEAARGGNGFFYGWASPKDGQAVTIGTLQYLLPENSTLGLRYMSLPIGTGAATAHGVMAFWGWWL